MSNGNASRRHRWQILPSSYHPISHWFSPHPTANLKGWEKTIVLAVAHTVVGTTPNMILPGTWFVSTCFSASTTSGSNVVQVLLLKRTLPEKPRILIRFLGEDSNHVPV